MKVIANIMLLVACISYSSNNCSPLRSALEERTKQLSLSSSSLSSPLQSNNDGSTTSSSQHKYGMTRFETVIVNQRYILDSPIQTPLELTSRWGILPWDSEIIDGGDNDDPLNEKYKLDNRFSRGGCGEVWLARDLKDVKKRKFVLKRIFPEKMLSGMREIYFGESLRGDIRATRFIEYFNRTSTISKEIELWLVFEDEGSSLKDFLYESTVDGMVAPSSFWKKLRKTGKEGAKMRREIARQLVLSLHSLSIKKIVHRDIKPGNILIATGMGRHASVKIGDYGSAIDLVSFQKGLFGMFGPTRQDHTKLYEPPEFLSFNITESLLIDNFDSSFDAWSTGVVLLELLLGTDRVFQLNDRVKRKRNKMHSRISQTETSAFIQDLEDFGIDNIQRFNESVRLADPFGRGFFDSAESGHFELNFVFSFLRMDPTKRMTFEQALRHPYLSHDDLDFSEQCETDFFSSSPSPSVSGQNQLPDGIHFVCGKCERVFTDWAGCQEHAKIRGHVATKFDPKHPEKGLCLTSNADEILPEHFCQDYTNLNVDNTLGDEEIINGINGVWCGNQGGKRYSEDFFISSKGSPQQTKNHVYIVVDGHFGENAARFSAVRLLELVENTEFAPFNFEGFITKQFAQVEEEFFHKFPSDESGTAVSIAIMKQKQLFIANIGDVRVLVCCDSKFEPIVLTEDHHASLPTERERVEAMSGGFVKEVNGRIRLLGKLALSRAIGDRPFLPYIIATPFTTVFNISEKYSRFLVIGSDGIFDAVSNSDVIKIIWIEMVKSEGLVGVSTADLVDGNNNIKSIPWFQRAARRLVFEAQARGVTLDNSGVAVIPL